MCVLHLPRRRRLPARLCAAAILLGAARAPGTGLPGAGDEAAVETAGMPIDRVQARVRLQADGAGLGRVRFRQRLEARAGPWELSALVERDPGERRWLDHAPVYAQRTTPRLDVAVGSLRPAFGQGLLFGRGVSPGVPPTAPRREATRLGYRSMAERRAVFGAAARWRGAGWTAALLAGRLRWDARLEDGVAVSLPEDGDHSGSGAARRRRLRGGVVAGRWTAAAGPVTLGVGLQRLAFARRIDLRRDGEPYGFHGRRLDAAGADVGLRRGRLRGVAAVARSGGRVAGLAAASGAAPAGVRVELLARRYAAGYFAPLAAAASGADMDDEAGLTLQARARRWRLWVDATERPRPRWRQPLPSWRRGAGLHVDRRRGGWLWSGDGQLRRRSLWVGGAARRESTWRWRLQGRDRRPAGGWTLRLDASRARRTGEAAAGASAALARTWRGRRLRADLLATGFVTDGYAARIYEYEPELPGGVSIRPVYGSGGRFVAVLRRQVGGLELGLRWRLLWTAAGARQSGALQVEAVSASR